MPVVGKPTLGGRVVGVVEQLAGRPDLPPGACVRRERSRGGLGQRAAVVGDRVRVGRRRSQRNGVLGAQCRHRLAVHDLVDLALLLRAGVARGQARPRPPGVTASAAPARSAVVPA